MNHSKKAYDNRKTTKDNQMKKINLFFSKTTIITTKTKS